MIVFVCACVCVFVWVCVTERETEYTSVNYSVQPDTTHPSTTLAYMITAGILQTSNSKYSCVSLLQRSFTKESANLHTERPNFCDHLLTHHTTTRYQHNLHRHLPVSYCTSFQPRKSRNLTNKCDALIPQKDVFRYGLLIFITVIPIPLLFSYRSGQVILIHV
jgi:hypothetical protein